MCLAKSRKFLAIREEVRSLQGILDLGILVSPGDRLSALTTSLERSGFLVAAAQGREEAIALADRAESLLQFVVKE